MASVFICLFNCFQTKGYQPSSDNGYPAHTQSAYPPGSHSSAYAYPAYPGQTAKVPGQDDGQGHVIQYVSLLSLIDPSCTSTAQFP